MVDTATKTPRPEDHTIKAQLQKEILAKLKVFDTVLGEYKSKDAAVPLPEEDIDSEDGSNQNFAERLNEDFDEDGMDFFVNGPTNPDDTIEYPAFSDEESWD